MANNKQRDLRYVGSSKKDLSRLPDEVKEIFAFGLFLAQKGNRHPDAKTLSGMGSAKIVEIKNRHEKNAYRAVYTVQFKEAIYVLHIFQKKSTKGISTPKPDMDLIKKRLKDAELLYKKQYK